MTPEEIGYTYDGGGWYIILPHGRIGPFIGIDKTEAMVRLIQYCIDDAYERAAATCDAQAKEYDRKAEYFVSEGCTYTAQHEAAQSLATAIRMLKGQPT